MILLFGVLGSLKAVQCAIVVGIPPYGTAERAAAIEQCKRGLTGSTFSKILKAPRPERFL